MRDQLNPDPSKVVAEANPQQFHASMEKNRREWEADQEAKRQDFQAKQERGRQKFEERLEAKKALRDLEMLIITLLAVGVSCWIGYEARHARLDAADFASKSLAKQEDAIKVQNDAIGAQNQAVNSQIAAMERARIGALKSSKDSLKEQERSVEAQIQSTVLGERPFIAIKDAIATLNPPSIPLNSDIRGVGFTIEVENRGRHFAQYALLSGRMLFPDRNRGIKTLDEMKAECQRPSPFTSPAGLSIGPGQTRTLNASAVPDFEGLEKQLHDPAANSGVAAFGVLVGCVTYHTELTKRPLHTAFAFFIDFIPSSPLSLEQIRDFQDHGSQKTPRSLPREEVSFEQDSTNSYSD